MPSLMTFFRVFVAALLFAAVSPVEARHNHRDDARGLAGTTILIIRHAEKPADESGGAPGLSPSGEARAHAYADYFRHFEVEGLPVKIDTLIATADSSESARPRLTLEPLSKATGIAIQQPFADNEVKALARWLEDGQPGRTVLIAWHHGKIPKLLEKLGADPLDLLPDGEWPSEIYDWVIVLRYDRDGLLSVSKRVVEPEPVD